jgi:hypothetical protein
MENLKTTPFYRDFEDVTLVILCYNTEILRAYPRAMCKVKAPRDGAQQHSKHERINRNDR